MTTVLDINEIDIGRIKNPLLQALLIAIFTDAAADESELPEYAKGQQGGWWGDDLEMAINGRQTKIRWGSKLWMLKRAKMTDDEAGLANLLLQECLTPLIDAGFIAENSVTFEKQKNMLVLIIPLESETYEIKGIEQWLGL